MVSSEDKLKKIAALKIVDKESNSINESFNKQKFGRYKVGDRLGKGGMGEVFKAYDEQLGRSIALKVIKKCDNQRIERETRFEIEAKAMAKLRHQNIVAVYDIGKEEGHPFFTMELIDGSPLKKLIKDEYFTSIEKVMDVFIKMVKAIHYAHTQEVIHRDLKPSNVIIGKDGEPYILDFGIARIDNEPGVTASGQVVGTWQYMSPEQINGKQDSIGKQTDIYSLGAILYEMLVGKPPISGEPQEIVYKIFNEKPKQPIELKKDIPEFLNKICLKALEIDKYKRYQSAESFIKDLEKFSKQEIEDSLLEKRLRLIEKRQRRALLYLFTVFLLLFAFYFAKKIEKQPIPSKSSSEEQIVSLDKKIKHIELTISKKRQSIPINTEIVKLKSNIKALRKKINTIQQQSSVQDNLSKEIFKKFELSTKYSKSMGIPISTEKQGILGDFNGDGFLDKAVYINDHNWEVSLSKNTGILGKKTIWKGHGGGHDNCIVGDFNGDGLSDIAGYTESNKWHVTLSDGKNFVDKGVWVGHRGGYDNCIVGDFNGDGLSDIAGYTHNKFQEWDVSLSNGVDGFTKRGSGLWVGHGGGVKNCIVGDFNGDGLSDIAGYTAKLREWDVKLSNGKDSFDKVGSGFYILDNQFKHSFNIAKLGNQEKENSINTKEMQIYTGSTAVGKTDWKVYFDGNKKILNSIYVDIDISQFNLGKNPLIIPILNGKSAHWLAQGGSHPYMEENGKFRIYITYPTEMTPKYANELGWHIRWVIINR